MKKLDTLSGGDVVPPEKRDVVESAEMQRAQAETQAAFIVAFKRPRDETKSRLGIDKSLERLAFAESSFYSYPRGGTEIFGPSINLAREFARLWGNIRFGFRVVHDTDNERTIEGYAWDMETNTLATSQSSFGKLIQRKVTDGKGGYIMGADGKPLTKWIQPDERDLRELTERHAAIQMRNCILRLAPRDVIDDLVAKAREITKKGIDKKDIKQIRVDAVKTFETIGVYEDKLNVYCEKEFGHGIDKTTPNELMELKGIFTAIKEGNASRDEYFTHASSPPPPAEEKKPEITMDDFPKGPLPPPVGALTPSPILPPVTPQQTEESNISEQEQIALRTLRQDQYDVYVIMLQRHRKELNYGGVLDKTLSFKEDLDKKIIYLVKELKDAGVDIEKEYVEIEREHKKKKAR